MTQQYSQIPLDDEEFSVQFDNESKDQAYLISRQSVNSASVGSNLQVAISRPPTKGRDKLFILLFFLHFCGIGLFTLLEKSHGTNSLLHTSKVGTWTSMVMIAVILGSFFGSLVLFLLSNSDSRIFIISSSLPISIIIQICFANIFFIFGHNLFFLGIILIISALYFSTYYKRAKESTNFSAAIIQFIGEISRIYGMWLSGACIGIVFLHTCFFLGWGVFLITLLANISTQYFSLLLIGLTLSFYWVTKFFHALISYIIGGCIAFYFIRDENEHEFDPKSRVFFHVRCALTTSLGSVCKGSLINGFCDFILVLHFWSINRNLSNNSGGLLPPSQLCTCLGRFFNCKRVIAAIISPFISFAFRNHRLSFCLTAIYGKTFSKAGEEFSSRFPQNIELSLTDICHFNLSCVAVEVAGIISIFFGLFSFSENKDNYSEGIFLAIIYFLAYSGVSLSVEIYKSSIDALIISYALKPEKLANENQIIFLRFLRTADPSLR